MIAGKMMRSGLVLVALLVSAAALAQTTGDYRAGFTQTGNAFSFQTTTAAVRLEFCDAGMFRVRTSWDGTFEPEEHLMVVKYQWEPVNVQVSEEANRFLLTTDSLRVLLAKTPFSLRVYDRAGKLLLADTLNGARRSGDSVSVTKRLQADEHFFGFGERMDFIDQRNKQLRLNVGRGKGRPHEIGAYNILEANYSPIPFFMSTRGYGVFLHNSYETFWDMGLGQGDAYTFGAVNGELDYYVIQGPKFKDIMARYIALTGRSPLLPRFALGLHAGTYSGGTWGHEHLTSDQYVIALARKFRELGIPVDLLWLDSTWRIFGTQGGKGATSFEWRETFSNPQAMFDSLYAMNYSMVGLHLRPRFDNGKTMNLLDRARAEGYVYPEPDEYGEEKGEFVNFFDDASVNWWWENGVKKLADTGAMFLKTDEGSAFGGKANESDKTGPTDKKAQQLHNVFPIAYAKAPYEKFQQHNGIRGLNHTREGYAGIQRYPFIFAGDWPSEWQYFLPVIKAGINIGLSGVGYWTHCMGGFEHPADPELYIRWVQFGMFSPIAMVFGMDHPGYKEPWNYGDDALRNFVKYDSLRYRLIPYLYSHAYELYRTGTPLMRALAWDYQDDPNGYDIGDQYLFGENLMVCPVVTKDAKTRTVYLPQGVWYDYWTGKRYDGRQYIHVTTPLDTLPIFAKAGAIIPMQTPRQFMEEKPVDTITLDIFLGNGKFMLYDDDGRSLDYQKGGYALTPIATQWDGSRLTLTVGEPEGNYRVGARQYVANVRTKERPKAVRVEGREADWHYDDTAGAVQVRIADTDRQIRTMDMVF
ncbi:Alpha-glucosidase, glycosyl hydrolase family GH31 [Parapedobacter composti]|uniref:Alpha-glucosidase, glycosyl hydrolase family GH31 n=1 Tax=Parapedobacter composti TaxID=623281 RepID=A0A1I1E849_9SPHI|nr:TIM-barrel domain-containing protein [Parapedobacter composti]SFB81133.1 Alpha-glucosidase, glycosyl hydrolase family GH31 [Parapedobacter composti]